MAAQIQASRTYSNEVTCASLPLAIALADIYDKVELEQELAQDDLTISPNS